MLPLFFFFKYHQTRDSILYICSVLIIGHFCCPMSSVGGSGACPWSLKAAPLVGRLQSEWCWSIGFQAKNWTPPLTLDDRTIEHTEWNILVPSLILLLVTTNSQQSNDLVCLILNVNILKGRLERC